jgi:hypothetical protein
MVIIFRIVMVDFRGTILVIRVLLLRIRNVINIFRVLEFWMRFLVIRFYHEGEKSRKYHEGCSYHDFMLRRIKFKHRVLKALVDKGFVGFAFYFIRFFGV